VSERRANDNDPKAKGYELGDLEIMPSRRASGAHPAVTATPPVPTKAQASATQAAPVKTRGAPRNLTLADGDIGPALELDTSTSSTALPRVSPPEVRIERRAQPPRAPTSGSSASHAPVVVTSAPATHATATASAAALASFGTDALDDFDEGFAQLPQLEVEKIERRSGDRVITRDPAEEERANEQKEADAIRALAHFNDAPDGLVASVPYAVHVATRLFKLRKERGAAIEQQRLRAEEHKAALVALGQALMAQAGDKRMEPLRNKVAHVHDERAKLDRADQGVERTREGNQRALNLMQSEAEHLKEELAPYMAAEKDALAVQRKADEEVRRAQAMQKRVEIELRALEAAASVDEARLDALNAQLEQREKTVETLTAALAQTNEALGKARRDLAMKRGALDLNEEKQKRLEAESRAREQEAEGHKQAANGAYEAALCELSETARKAKLQALTPDAAAKVVASESALEQAGFSVLRFDRALKLYDRKAAIRGLAMMAGMIALVVVALVLR
jgi:hypothetical protein